MVLLSSLVAAACANPDLSKVDLCTKKAKECLAQTKEGDSRVCLRYGRDFIKDSCYYNLAFDLNVDENHVATMIMKCNLLIMERTTKSMEERSKDENGDKKSIVTLTNEAFDKVVCDYVAMNLDLYCKENAVGKIKPYKKTRRRGNHN